MKIPLFAEPPTIKRVQTRLPNAELKEHIQSCVLEVAPFHPKNSISVPQALWPWVRPSLLSPDFCLQKLKDGSDYSYGKQYTTSPYGAQGTVGGGGFNAEDTTSPGGKVFPSFSFRIIWKRPMAKRERNKF